MAQLLSTGFRGYLVSAKATGKKIKNKAGELVNEIIDDFVSGFSGHGWKIWGSDDRYKLEIDDIVVRNTMTVFELLISKIRAVKGALGITQASGKVKSVREDEENYYLEIEDEMSFTANDIVRCLEFNGSKRNYWVIISAVNDKEITIPKSEFEGESMPEGGDELVQFGNTIDTRRQSAIYLHADENGEPAIDVLFGINSKTFDGCVKVRMGGALPGESEKYKGFFCENGLIKAVNENGEEVYKLRPDGSGFVAKGNISWDSHGNGSIFNKSIYWDKDGFHFGSGIKLTWDNLSKDAQENLKGEPGKDANLLPWVEDYTKNATQIGGDYLISPRIFSGTNTGTADQPVLTGVALGRDVVTVDGIKKTGLFGLKNGKLIFSIDAETGDATFSGILNIGDSANVIRPDKTGHLANKNIIWDAEGNAIFKGIIYASGGYFTGKIQSSHEGKRFIIDPSGDPSFKMISRSNKTLAHMSFIQSVPDVADTEMTTFKIYNYIADFPVGILTTTLSAFGLSISDGIDDSMMGNQNNVVLISKGAIIFKNLHYVKDTTGYSRVLIDTKTGELAYG